MSGEPTYRVAVIGLGYFSQFHLKSWAGIDGVALVGVCDRDGGRADEVAAELGVKGYSDAAQMIAETKPDIIDIVAPPPAHDALVRAALEPGRVVICQKPFTTSIAAAEALAMASTSTDTTLIIHENFRFQPWHRAVKSFLQSGQMGEVFQVRFALRPGDGRGPEAYLDRQPAFQTMPRLLIHETGVHFVDLFRWLLGEITHVHADLRQLNPALAGEDAGVLTMTHAGGARSVFDGNRLADHATDNPRRTMGEMEIEGSGGTLRLDGMGALRFRAFGSRDWQDIPVPGPIDETAFGGGCVDLLNRHVVAALRGDAPFENEAAEYLSVMRATEAAYQSNETGCRVALAKPETR
ncbi:Gfo/Idh/MocA family protein [Shimia biformata]|uniref:Gfo/Idh/MocA family protein n=1 Tax=Shimia biformata TaxID=1294299 RepID=UPI00194E9FF9|nr:Gfo/Idh/MocA family oxidoreductase [Shimia biformata]